LVDDSQVDTSNPFVFKEEHQESKSHAQNPHLNYKNGSGKSGFLSSTPKEDKASTRVYEPSLIVQEEGNSFSSMCKSKKQTKSLRKEGRDKKKQQTVAFMNIYSHRTNNPQSPVLKGTDTFRPRNGDYDSMKYYLLSSSSEVFKNPEFAQFEKVDSDTDYSMLVKRLMNRSDKYGTSIKHRKDVVNKKILRSFRKFISACFKVKNKKPSKITKPFDTLKQELVVDAQKIGLYTPVNSKENSEEFEEFICWLAMNKMTQLAKSKFDYNNEAIMLLSDILEKYSHSKLAKI